MITAIVGARFRPPADGVLRVLPMGTGLWLRPEPENEYDSNAIQVGIDAEVLLSLPEANLSELEVHLPGFGWDMEMLHHFLADEGELHLGYVPRAAGVDAAGLPAGKSPGTFTLIDNPRGGTGPAIQWETA